MKAIRKGIYLFILYLNSFMLFAMFSILFTQVIFRRWIGEPLSWSEEVSLLIMVWVTLMGAYQCTAEDSHLKMSFLEDNLPSAIKPYILIVSKGFIIWFLWIASSSAFPLLTQAGGTTLPITGIPMYVPYGVIWISLILMIVETLLQLIGIVHKLLRGRRPSNQALGRGEQ